MFAISVNPQGVKMDGSQLVVSMVGGGLAGGAINVLFNRIFYWRSLRIRFYPILCDMFSAYRIRMEDPDNRYWVATRGKGPLPKDSILVGHRSSFLLDLIQFTELREVRKLRSKILKNERSHDTEQEVVTIDLKPESEALLECVKKIQKKLRLS